MARERNTAFEAAEVVHIFPTCVWRAEVERDIRRKVNKAILAKLESIERESPGVPPDQAWQTDQDMHEAPEFQELISCLGDAVRDVLDFLKVREKRFLITGGWANVGPPGAAHQIHSHANNFLSAVYYVRTGEGADTISFYDPRIQNQVILPPVTERTPENTERITMKVKEGTLLIFPSWLQHSVDPNKSDTTRISASFNVMFPDFAETIAHTNWN